MATAFRILDRAASDRRPKIKTKTLNTRPNAHYSPYLNQYRRPVLEWPLVYERYGLRFAYFPPQLHLQVSQVVQNANILPLVRLVETWASPITSFHGDPFHCTQALVTRHMMVRRGEQGRVAAGQTCCSMLMAREWADPMQLPRTWSSLRLSNLFTTRWNCCGWAGRVTAAASGRKTMRDENFCRKPWGCCYCCCFVFRHGECSGTHQLSPESASLSKGSPL